MSHLLYNLSQGVFGTYKSKVTRPATTWLAGIAVQKGLQTASPEENFDQQPAHLSYRELIPTKHGERSEEP
jgi:hypothetical protein